MRKASAKRRNVKYSKARMINSVADATMRILAAARSRYSNCPASP